jgi:hypothetical protein
MMTTPSEPPVTDPGPAHPDAPGFFTREAQRLLPHIEHAEAEAGHIAAEVQAALQDHAGTVYGVADGFLTVLKMIDPADAALFTAASALVPKVFAMVEKATALAQSKLPAA